MGTISEIKQSGVTGDELAHAAAAVGQLPWESSTLEYDADGRGGTAVAATVEVPALRNDVRTAYLIDSGPKGEGDFPDARYWAVTAIPSIGSDGNLTFAPDGDADDLWVQATNLGEWATGTHLLPPGTPVKLMRVPEAAGKGDVYVFAAAPPEAVVFVKIVSAIDDAGGKYNGQLGPVVSMTDDATGDFDLPDGLTPGTDCLVVNDDESGNTDTHWIESDTYTEGVYGGMSTEDTPRPIIRVLRGEYVEDGANELAGGTDEAAQTDIWDRSKKTVGTDFGESMSETYVTRVVFDAAGDAKLYQYQRTRVTAADGRVVSVSAETRSVVDTPDDDCT